MNEFYNVQTANYPFSIIFFFVVFSQGLSGKMSVSLEIAHLNGTPLQYSCLENPMGGGAWWAAVHGVTKS